MSTTATILLGIIALSYAFGLEITAFILGSIALILALAFSILYIWVKRRFSRPLEGVVGFFHPFANGAGGGERVLWVAIQALQNEYPNLSITIYCQEGCTPKSLSAQASSRFNIKIRPTFTVIPLKSTSLILPENYPRFTMVRQAIASIRLSIEALSIAVPDVWIDTTGWAFPYPLIRLAGSKVVAYVHYPTISTDMLHRVRHRHAMYNNDSRITSSMSRSWIKLIYYQTFAAVYGAVGACADVVMVNSSWTRRHIAELWWHRQRPLLVYPPCDTADLQALPLDRRLKRLYVISVAQFRPEKDHELQLRAFAAARAHAAKKTHDRRLSDAVLSAQLQLVGGCRGAADEARLESLRQLSRELGLGDDDVEFRVNVPYSELKMLLGDAVAGLHTMADEHFGISVVEYMAAGVVPITHNSGGPREDIVIPEPGSNGGPVQRTGYLCTTEEEYCASILEVLGMDQMERLKIAAAARKRAAAFSDNRFKQEFLEGIRPVVDR